MVVSYVELGSSAPTVVLLKCLLEESVGEKSYALDEVYEGVFHELSSTFPWCAPFSYNSCTASCLYSSLGLSSGWNLVELPDE